MDDCLKALDCCSGEAAMLFERRMSEFMVVSESNLRDCSNVHPATVRQTSWNGLMRDSTADI